MSDVNPGGRAERTRPSVQADNDARRTIRDDLRVNLLVEAGAGSGKTQMLAERMAAGVAAGAYQVEHMAAVTFTRKAASELRMALWIRDDPGVRLELARLLGELGRDGEARAEAERVLAADPANEEARTLAGRK